MGRSNTVTTATDSRQRNVSSARFRLLATLAAGFIVGAIAVAVLWMTREVENPAPTMASALAQLTFDDGYTEGPAVSPDGTLVAYASDRAGSKNLDVWIQRAAGDGDPIQLTRGEADERQPSFSPDGGQILYRSEAETGGLFTIPALGGQPRLLVERGIDGRYSPDGKSIAYWTGSQIGFISGRPGAYRTFIIPGKGGSPAELRGFTNARFPIWSPDGRLLLVAGSQAKAPVAQDYDWWIVRLADGQAFPTGAADRLRAAGVNAGPAGAAELVPPAAAWVGNRIIAAGAGNLSSVELGAPPEYSAREVQRLVFGPGRASDAAASRDGLIAFIGANATHNIWSLPIDAETATVRGELRQVTNTGGHYSRVTVSADRQLLAFQVQRGKWTIMVKDTATGQIVDLAVPARPYGPAISPDGTKVAFPANDGGVSVVAVRGGAARKVCDDCEPGDWTRDGRWITVAQGDL